MGDSPLPLRDAGVSMVASSSPRGNFAHPLPRARQVEYLIRIIKKWCKENGVKVQ